MEHRNLQRQTGRRRACRCPGNGGAGFTLLEMVVVITVLGILTAAVIVSWSSFMRHQELRSDAITLHKEIIALRARAVENGDSARMTSTIDGSVCNIEWKVNDPTESNPDASVWRTKGIPLNKSVIVKTEVISSVSGDLSKLPNGTATETAASNKWVTGNAVNILIDPDILKDDPLNAFQNGRIILASNVNSVKSRYCIQKDSTCMRPELYQQTKSGAPWKRL
jgi:prepilin-type N-terminal cleavage/methylation domain-containing protein